MAAFGACACKLSWTLLFDRPGSAPIWGGKKGEFRDWTRKYFDSTRLAYTRSLLSSSHALLEMKCDMQISYEMVSNAHVQQLTVSP